MNARQFEVEILVAYQQYDSETGLVRLVVDRKSIPGDQDIIGLQVMQFVQTELETDHGFLWSIWHTQQFISSYVTDVIPV